MADVTVLHTFQNFMTLTPVGTLPNGDIVATWFRQFYPARQVVASIPATGGAPASISGGAATEDGTNRQFVARGVSGYKIGVNYTRGAGTVAAVLDAATGILSEAPAPAGAFQFANINGISEFGAFGVQREGRVNRWTVWGIDPSTDGRLPILHSGATPIIGVGADGPVFSDQYLPATPQHWVRAAFTIYEESLLIGQAVDSTHPFAGANSSGMFGSVAFAADPASGQTYLFSAPMPPSSRFEPVRGAVAPMRGVSPSRTHVSLRVYFKVAGTSNQFEWFPAVGSLVTGDVVLVHDAMNGYPCILDVFGDDDSLIGRADTTGDVKIVRVTGWEG